MKSIDKNLSRRNFIRLTGMTGAALTIGYATPVWAKESGELLTAETAEAQSIEPITGRRGPAGIWNAVPQRFCRTEALPAE